MTDKANPSATSKRMSRRQWVWACLLGAAAAGTGTWLATRRAAPAAPPAAPPEAGPIDQPYPEQLPSSFWALTLAGLDGQPLELNRFKGSPWVLNFWATWCPPCVKELPLLDEFHRQHQPQGWQMLGLAIDETLKVQEFLQRTPVGFPVATADMTGLMLTRKLGNAAGGLPFSVVIGPTGAVKARKIGALSADDLQQWSRMF